jgi:hypothetical protein
MEEHQFKLISSTYNPEDARHVLLSLIQDKIKSINNLCFGIEERGTHDTSHFRKRIVALTQMREEIKDLLAAAEDAGAAIEIDASIQIKIKEPVKG